MAHRELSRLVCVTLVTDRVFLSNSLSTATNHFLSLLERWMGFSLTRWPVLFIWVQDIHSRRLSAFVHFESTICSCSWGRFVS